ncbi:MAG: response regulator transcription factor [Pseudomonadota bacterium]
MPGAPKQMTHGFGAALPIEMKVANYRTAVGPDVATYGLLIEEKPICRMAIAQVVGECAGLGEVRFVGGLASAAKVLAEQRTALLIIDLFTINYDFRGLQRLLSAAPSIASIVIDDRVNPTFAQIARDGGAHGYISKDFDLDQFQHAIGAVSGGGSYFPASLLPRLVARPRGRSTSGLSPRQVDVLKQIAVGRRNREIAEALDITPGTVKLHIHAILRLTGARNRTEAALLAGRFLAPNSEG